MIRWQDYTVLYPGSNHTVVGTIKVLEQLWSPQLENRRDILVYLPPSYASDSRQYPVIYMHDGQNLFDRATSNSGEWEVDETMQALSAEGIEAMVVGVPHMGDRRMVEYTPFKSTGFGLYGDGDHYLTFLCETVKPLIDEDFRTLPDRNHTGIMGSSMGAIISLYAFFRRPDIFGFAGLLSPAFLIVPRMFGMVEVAAFSAGKIYMDVGTREFAEDENPSLYSTAQRYVEDARRMRDLLVEKGYRAGENLIYREDEGGVHHESAWARRLPDALRFLLKD